MLTIGVVILFEYSFSLRRAHDIGENWRILFRYGIRNFINGLKLTYAQGNTMDNEYGVIPNLNISLRELFCIK